MARLALALISCVPVARASGALGVDLGGANSVVATAQRGGVDVLVNEASRRQTPSVVAFTEQQRLLGQSAAPQQTSSPTDCVADIKALLGLRLEAARRALRQPSAPLVDGADNAEPLVEVLLRGEARRFSATQLLAMLLHQLHRCAEREAADALTECTIAVPLYFGPVQRRAVLDAAEIAGLRSCRLISDGAAAALDYALGRDSLPVDTDHHVAFVDAGASGVQVCVVAVRRDSLRILSHAYAADTGGAVRASTAAHARPRVTRTRTFRHTRHARRARTCWPMTMLLTIPRSVLHLRA
jgi:molecular chaperone DnaK (HSP70)